MSLCNGGAGRLSQKVIKSIQGHYGAAITESGNIQNIRNAIYGISSITELEIILSVQAGVQPKLIYQNPIT